jgi:hypothetical protein
MNMRKKLLIVSFMIMALICATATPRVSAQDCSTPGPFREVMKQLTQKCKNLTSSAQNLIDCVTSAPLYGQILGVWNTLAGNSLFTIGPREAIYNQTQQGATLTPGDRTFLAAPSDKSSVTLSVKKRGGKAQLKLSICKVNGDGVVTHLDTFTFPSDAPVGQEYKKTFSGVLGHGFTIFLDGQGAVATKFEYDLRLSK